MNYAPNNISSLIEINHKGFVGFGYGQIKFSAEQAAVQYGCEWAKKYPKTREAFELRHQIRSMVMSHVPSDHSNKDVVWQRFRQYALKFCGQ